MGERRDRWKLDSVNTGELAIRGQAALFFGVFFAPLWKSSLT